MKTKLEINIEKVTDGLYKSYFIGIGEPFFNFFAIGKTRKEAFELLMYGMNELINKQKLDYKLGGDATPEDEWELK
ncbi:MAG: hypothetical protein ACTTKY_00310 [Catonella sp.]